MYIIADWVILFLGINTTKKDAYVSDGIYKIFIAIFFDNRNWKGLIFISGRINKYNVIYLLSGILHSDVNGQSPATCVMD